MQSSYTKHNISDYIGKKYGMLTVIGASPKTHRYSNKFDFQCECGNIISESPGRVLSGHKKSCGMCRKRNTSYEVEQKVKDSIGTKIGKLKIIGVSHNPNSGLTFAQCKCDCGNVVDVLPYQLFRNDRKSCGCLKRNNKMLANNDSTSSGNYQDGQAMHPLYGLWKMMLSRCEDPKANHYDRYGGRGIKVCDEWHDFWEFAKWSNSVGGRPEGYTLDRIDNDGNYEPSNCRWANWKTQTSNKSSNRFIVYNGKSQTIQQWSLELGINRQTLTNRINRGWSIERAINTKPFVGNNQHTNNK